MATIGISALSLVLIQNKKTAALNSIRLAGDRDAEYVVAKIRALMSSPADCNANFKGKRFVAPYTAFTKINRCPVGDNCNTTGIPVPVIDLNNVVDFNNWKPIIGEPRKRVRITSISYTLTTQQSTDTAGNRPRAGYPKALPAIVTLSVVIEKNLGLRGSTMVTSKNTLKPYTFEVYVITSSYNFTTNNLNDYNPKNISGCARSPSSVIVYPN